MLTDTAIDGATRHKTHGKTREPTEGTLVRRSIELTGRTPLLLNRLSEETLLNVRSKTRRPKNAPVPSPREEADTKVYLHDGKVVLPAQNLLSSLIEAGKWTRLDGKRQLSTSKATTLPAFLTLEDAFIPIVDPETRREAAWEVDIRGGKNPNGNEVVCIVRPRFDVWVLNFTVQIDCSEIGEDVMRTLFDNAGLRVGVGDFRPQRKGIYGQFRVTNWSKSKS